ncbi:MAG TPA: type II secretion system F family protein [Terriglobales bacterium]|nr:type II secretion system F family protein [Terriglobales bacterium]
MALVLAVLIFIAVALAVFAFMAAFYAPSSVIGSRLRSLMQRPQQEKPAIRDRFEQALDPLSKALPLSDTDTNRTRGWLVQAGYRESRHLTIYQGIRVLFAAIGFVSVLLIGGLKSPPLLVGLTGLGFFIPRFFLKRMINDRQSRIRVGMPDALDLTVICVEAGLSLDQAMMRVGEDLRHAHPDLSDEFYLMNLELRAGKPRAEALRNLYNRTGVDDIKALVTTLVQTDRFGTSIAQALRVHSDSLRTERRQRAEEQAAKTTIKMVPPLVVFVLPSIIIVTLGPAIIQLYRTLIS